MSRNTLFVAERPAMSGAVHTRTAAGVCQELKAASETVTCPTYPSASALDLGTLRILAGKFLTASTP